jgi:hypothetical protein
MKKINLLMVFVLASMISFGQMIPKGIGTQGKISKSVIKIEKNSSKSTIDTIGWTATSYPCFASPTGEIHTYYMADANQNRIGYWFGVNADSTDYWAQSYVNTATIYISGVLALVSGKYNSSSSSSSVMNASLYLVAPDQTIIDDQSNTTGPGPNVYQQTALETVSKTIANLDTANYGSWGWNYFQFPTLGSVSADFSIVTDFQTIREHGDTAYLFCDAIGDGLGLNYTCYTKDPQTYYWVATSVSTLDVNMSAFAVIEEGGGINDADFYQGMKLSVYPNPVSKVASIDYALQYNSKASIDIINMAGKVIKTIDLGSKSIGKYNTTINVEDLASGNYFISLNANGTKFIKKLIVE